MQQLLPEWAPQEAILLAWPDNLTDWRPWLADVRKTYLSLISQLNDNHTPVIMLIRPDEIAVCEQLINNYNTDQQPQITRLLLLPADYNDTWLRDYGFLTVSNGNRNIALNFAFNGWGNKFNASKDTAINERVFAPLLQHPLQSTNFVLEGGALEINAKGQLLTTQLCLSNPERNGEWHANDQLQILNSNLNSGFNANMDAAHSESKVIILRHGHLEGDDTDGHIDTLVRFTPDDNLVIQSSHNRPLDSHFTPLQKLVEECAGHFPESTLFELPLPELRNQEQERLPGSYANFLISNHRVFAPIYQEPEDQQALTMLRYAFPDFDIIPIDCRPLIQQFGSLHCITMQVPTGTLKPSVVSIANSGISIYE